MKLIWLGHSAFRVELGDKALLIDPFFTGNPAFEGAFGAQYEELISGVTHIILTHGHGDHMGDTLAIAEKTGATIIANFDLCMWLQAKGAEKIDPTNTGGTVYHDGFSVSYVNAVHSSAFLTEDGTSHCLGNANGIILKADGEPTLYHMGDTDIFSDMALINEIYQPEIGLVPIGDRFTMNARVAALACKRFFKFRTVIPCHYGSFPIIAPNADEFLAEMKGERVIAPDVGMPVEV